MAASAGSSYGGTLFRINIDATGFQVMRRFSVSDGQWPWGSLLQSGSVLYGLNTYGGNSSGWNGKGTAFRINTDGTGFQVLHTFAGGTNNGIGPHGTFMQSGSTLYATTLVGGRSNLGTLFKMNPDGTGFQILHHFTGGSSDGSGPYNVQLVQSGSTFYGMTMEGGSKNMGTLFKMEVDGTGFGLLHSFTGGSEGQKPFGSLILSGSVLYGMTSDENTGTDGTVFQINTDGTGYQVLHRFNGTEGRDPCGSLLLCNGRLYGMTSQGGTQNKGVIFALDVPGPRLVPEQYPTIQAAIDAAQTGDVIQVAPGTYQENITIAGKDLVLRSRDANDPNVTAETILEGNGTDPVAKLQNCTEQCVMAGLTIRSGGTGIWCSGGQPAIQGCQIIESTGPGIELLSNAKPLIDHCIIAASGGLGIKMPRPLPALESEVHR